MIDLHFNRVSKRYRIRRVPGAEAPESSLANRLRSLRRQAEEFWAVRDVSFEVARGETLGIIGHNGAGKSTVLKMLSNITTPTSGEITINGRLNAIIEVGSGFHPELTGRENVYLSGSILGMRRREIARKLDSIVEFAGVRQFIDTPVKRYSSGMFVRLGFSIAAHLDPHILLLDEVLAVGDAAFQRKCFQRIQELKQAGTTIVFISHDLASVERLCDRALLMQRGEVVAGGAARDVIAEYEQLTPKFAAAAGPDPQAAPGSGAKVKFTSFSLLDIRGRETTHFATGDPVRARIGYVAYEHVPGVSFHVDFWSQEKELRCNFMTEQGEACDLASGAGVVEFYCPALGLLPGLYNVDIAIKRRGEISGHTLDFIRGGVVMRVDPGRMVRGSFYSPYEWRLEQEAPLRTYGRCSDNGGDQLQGVL